jgi:hypothetical protein
MYMGRTGPRSDEDSVLFTSRARRQIGEADEQVVDQHRQVTNLDAAGSIMLALSRIAHQRVLGLEAQMIVPPVLQ